MIKRAIILAGGLSERIKPLSNNMVKCLLPITNEETILGRIIRLLKKNGVEEIILVVGYKQEALKKEFGNSVKYIEDPLYKKEGMLDSLLNIIDKFDQPFLFMYADSIVSDRAVKKILGSKKGDIVTLVADKKVDDESEKVKIVDELLVGCNKIISNKEADGEFTGMIIFTAAGAKKLKESFLLAKKEGQLEYKNVRDIIEFMIKRSIAIKAETVSDEDWMEVDFVPEYEHARNIFIKRLQELDGVLNNQEIKCKTNTD